MTTSYSTRHMENGFWSTIANHPGCRLRLRSIRSEINVLKCCSRKMKRFKKAVLKCPLLLIILYFLLRIRHGFSVYRTLCIRYGIKHTWYSAFLPSTGDMFFAAAVYPELKRLEQTQQEGIFLAVGDSGRQISEWFESFNA